MAMTKRMRVSFDLKIVVSSKEEETMCCQLAEITKAYAGGEKLDGLQLAMVKAAIELGPESALELALKKAIKDVIVEGFDGDIKPVSNFRFEVKR